MNINLQLFADGMFSGEAVEGLTNPLLETPQEETPQEETPQEETPEPQEEQLQEPQEMQQEPQQEIQQETPQEEFDIKTYLDNLMQNINEKLESLKPQTEEEINQITQEDIEKLNEEFMEKFYENPRQHLAEFVKQIVDEATRPYKEKLEEQERKEYWNNLAQEFAKTHPDYLDYVEDMARILQEKSYLQYAQNPYLEAYKLAKAERLSNQPKTLEEMLNDEENLNKIIQNEKIRNLILKQVMTEKKNQEIPNVIGNQGTSVPTPEETPKSLKDATKAWLKSIGLN
ncbi:MAG: hypothetical protein H0Z24_06825 [Thermosipho sp. (in: Bacteria)]|nr:hypothetical protein [Thermosipho sp. (in: thermotogales)]